MFVLNICFFVTDRVSTSVLIPLAPRPASCPGAESSGFQPRPRAELAERETQTEEGSPQDAATLRQTKTSDFDHCHGSLEEVGLRSANEVDFNAFRSRSPGLSWCLGSLRDEDGRWAKPRVADLVSLSSRVRAGFPVCWSMPSF